MLHPRPLLPTCTHTQVARDQLLQVCLQLQQHGAAATQPLLSALHLLHTYLLVRQLVRQGDHLAAARLLLVVADSIQAFPKHVVPILTSTVIECHRAALHSPAQVGRRAGTAARRCCQCCQGPPDPC